MKEKGSILVASIICFAAVVAMMLALSMKPQAEKTVFTPPPFASDAQTGTPMVEDDLGYTTLQNENMSFALSICGKPTMVGDTAQIYLTNLAENKVWLKLRVLDETGVVLAETGLIQPNEYLQELHFDTTPSDNQAITLKVMSYEMGTYYSRGSVSLNTTIKVEQ